MYTKTLKTLIYLTTLPEIVIELLFILFILLHLTDPIDAGYFSAEIYVLFSLQITTLIIQSFLFYAWRKSLKKIVIALVLGGLISLVLFGINWVICLSVGFS